MIFICDKRRFLYKLCRIASGEFYMYRRKIQDLARRSEALSNSRLSLIINSRNIIHRRRTILYRRLPTDIFIRKETAATVNFGRRTSEQIFSKPSARLNSDRNAESGRREKELYRASRRDFILAGSDERSGCQSRNLRIGRGPAVTTGVIAGFPGLAGLHE